MKLGSSLALPSISLPLFYLNSRGPASLPSLPGARQGRPRGNKAVAADGFIRFSGTRGSAQRTTPRPALPLIHHAAPPVHRLLLVTH